jgi:hypothetical protein
MTPSVELDWQMSETASSDSILQTGRQHQAGVQPDGCVMGNYCFFFSNGTTQTSATGVAPTPRGTTLVDTTQVASRIGKQCVQRFASNPLFPTSRVGRRAEGSQRHGRSGVPLRTRTRDDGSQYTRSNGRTGITYDYNAAASGSMRRRWDWPVKGSPPASSSIRTSPRRLRVPLVRRLSVRLCQ